MIKLANKIALQSFVKSAAEDGGDKPYSSAEPSFVDRLVMGPLANNVAREAETDGGAGLKAYLYPTLAGAGGSILGNVAGSELADVLDMSPRAQRNMGTAGSIAGGLAGLLGTIAMRNKAKSEDAADYTTSDITPGAVGQRMIGGALGGIGGTLGGGLAGAGAGAGLAALAALATGNDANQFARVGGVAGGALGAGISGLLGKAKGEEIADTLRQAREAKALNKKASLADWIAEYQDNQSSTPEWLSTTLGATTGAGALPAALQYSNYTGKAAEDLQEAKNLHKELALQLIKARQRLHSVNPNAMTSGAVTPRKLKDVYKEAVDALMKQRNVIAEDIRKVKPHAAFANSSVNKLIQTLGKNKQFAIPGAALVTGLGALGIHNMVD